MSIPSGRDGIPAYSECAFASAPVAHPPAAAVRLVGPRLLYADWLRTHGQGWGEYVQVACQLAELARTETTVAWSAERRTLADLETRLRVKHEQAWLQNLTPETLALIATRSQAH